ncbi:MAG: TonB-dependent receptor [Opitutaceae bacterium]|nr:TonB-dependent receptor [Opitutaceae bacterium]
MIRSTIRARRPGVIRALRAVAAALVALGAGAVTRAQGTAGGISGENLAVEMPELQIADSTEEQEAWPEEAPSMFPFRRSRLFGVVIEDEADDRRDGLALNEQLAALQDFNPGEFASTSGSGAPRGFTTPRLRNGLSQAGFPEIILGGRRDLLSGFLATYFGRTAPGGIVNHISTRPTPKPTTRLSLGADAMGEVRALGERNAPLGGDPRTKRKPKLHYRLYGEARWREGPQDFAGQDVLTGGLVFRYAPDKATVWMLEIETVRVDADPAGGIVLERATRTAPRGAPHLALEDFNTNGPNARSRRDSGIVSLFMEQKRSDDLTLRAGAEVWRRAQDELTFITGAYLLDTGIFDGVREPQYNGREEAAAGLHVELDGTGTPAGINHRWVVGAAWSHQDTDREQRALPRATRDQLPAAVRFLDPDAPDWSIVPYSEDVYSRILGLRDEQAEFAGVFGSERVALADDRIYGTFGLRQDWVWSSIDDLRPAAPVPHATSDVERATYHAGLVWHAWPNRLAVFLNNSTAFQPARRVDARTSRIIGDESTAGTETGLRYASEDGKTTATASAYRLLNQGITRTNPLYNDPVADPLKLQPQYVSSGEEQFTGVELGARRKFPRSLTLSGKVAWLEAITTSSPDLPEEVGRQLPRTPEFTATANARYAFEAGALKGADCGVSWAWVGDHVAVYPASGRARVAYDDYHVLGLSAGYAWQVRKTRHALSVSLRNALDEDLFAAAGRLGGARSLDAGYTVRF